MSAAHRPWEICDSSHTRGSVLRDQLEAECELIHLLFRLNAAYRSSQDESTTLTLSLRRTCHTSCSPSALFEVEYVRTFFFLLLSTLPDLSKCSSRSSQTILKRHLTCKWFPSSAIVGENSICSCHLTRFRSNSHWNSNSLTRLSESFRDFAGAKKKKKNSTSISTRAERERESEIQHKTYANSNWGWSFCHNSSISPSTRSHMWKYFVEDALLLRVTGWRRQKNSIQRSLHSCVENGKIRKFFDSKSRRHIRNQMSKKSQNENPLLFTAQQQHKTMIFNANYINLNLHHRVLSLLLLSN